MKSKASLAVQLLKITFSLYIVVTISVTVLQMYTDWMRAENFLREDLQEVGNSIKQGVILAEWDFNNPQRDLIINGILELPTLIGVEVKGIKETELYGEKGDIVIQYKLVHVEEEAYDIGEMFVFSSSRIVFSRVRDGYVILLINAMIKSFFLWLIVIWVSKKLIQEPLSTLTEATKKLSLDNLETPGGTPIQINIQTKGNNELKILETAFNFMIHNLFFARKELKKINQHLEKLVEERTEKLNQKTVKLENSLNAQHQLNKQLQASQLQIEESHKQLQKQHQKLKDTQTQLVHSEKMASLGVLVAGVAHEVNNPVHFIYMYTHILQKDLGDLHAFLTDLLKEEQELIQYIERKFERFDQKIQNINEGSARIKGIVANLRAFSRLDEAELKEVKITEGILSTLLLIQTEYKKLVEFECDFQSEARILCYPAQLNQVFMNLLMNACQAIEKKQQENQDEKLGKILVQTLEKNHQLGVRVIDTGCGMSEDTQQKIFEPFFTTKEVGKGTGLGMSINYGVIEKHQGTIEVESHLGEGTTVTVWLPLETE